MNAPEPLPFPLAAPPKKAGGAPKHATDRNLADSRALLIDGNPTSRSIIATQLRELGIEQLVQSSRVQEARRMLEGRAFDIVLCEQYFQDDSYTGQDLLDDLRRAQLLPFYTVFIMITGEATYSKVAEAAESALDSYLIKPHTAATLAERIKQARMRKRELRDIFEAIEANRLDDATRLCLQRFATRAPYWMYSARIGAELMIKQGLTTQAQQLYEAVLTVKPLSWARVGVARSQHVAQQLAAARKTVEALIADEPEHADARDLLGRVQFEQGQFSEALDSYRKASELTPGSIMRLQKQGLLAMLMGHRDEAGKTLERALGLGVSSKLFDHEALVMLALVRLQQADGKGLQRCHDELRHAEKSGSTPRLERFLKVTQVMGLLHQKQLQAVIEAVKPLVDELLEPGFDMEAAINLLALLTQIRVSELKLPDADDWIEKLAMRFVTSRLTADLLGRVAARHAPYAERLRNGHAKVVELAEKAMSHTLNGDPRSAVRSLIAQAGRTGNAKLVETARLTLNKYRESVKDADILEEMLEELRQRFVPGSALPALGQPQARSAGGLSMRVMTVEPPPAGTGIAVGPAAPPVAPTALSAPPTPAAAAAPAAPPVAPVNAQPKAPAPTKSAAAAAIAVLGAKPADAM